MLRTISVAAEIKNATSCCQFRSEFCAFGNGPGTCTGDSGGPLFLRENGRWVMCMHA